MGYAVFHIRIRKDENECECPKCNQPILTFFDTKESAIKFVHKSIKEFSESRELKELSEFRELSEWEINDMMDIIKEGYSIWIDQYENIYYNGDRYCILRLELNCVYNLSKPDMEGDGYYDYDYFDSARYILLQIEVNTDKPCPKHIKYYVSFHFMKDDAIKVAIDSIKNMKRCITDENGDPMQPSYFENKIEKLRKNNMTSIKDKTSDGEILFEKYYQIFDMSRREIDVIWDSKYRFDQIEWK